MRSHSRIALCLPLVVAIFASCSSDDGPNGSGPGPNNNPDGSTSPADGGQDTGSQAALKPLLRPSHGSTVAMTSDDAIVVVANRDVGTVSVFTVDYSAGAPTLTKTGEVQAGAELSSVVIHPDDNTAFALSRKDQRVTQITDLHGTPTKGAEVQVGSEPTGMAITPMGSALWVANFNDGTVSRIATDSMTVSDTIDLNKTLADTNTMGSVGSRPALAHPRAIAISNNGDKVELDESVYVTEFYSAQKVPLALDNSNADVAKVGFVYKIPLGTKTAAAIELPAIEDTGYHDHNDNQTGCFPNQVGAINVQGGFAYAISMCASPKGPNNTYNGPAFASCTVDATCPGGATGSCAGSSAKKCTTNCTTNTDCGANGGVCTNNVCQPNFADVKSMVHPVVSIIDTLANKTIAAVNLNIEFDKLYDARSTPDDANRRLPMNPLDIGFIPGTVEAYLPANGTDAVFKVNFNATYDASTVDSVGDAKAPFINLIPAGVDPSKQGKLPVGIGVAHKTHGDVRYAFVANEATRNLAVIDLANQEIAGLSSGSPNVVQASALPTGAEADFLEGKRLFNTGLGRWSANGQGWGACVTCHADGYSDNVTWPAGRGQHQANALDGTYNSKDPTDVRLQTWAGNLDELPDHEGAIRSFWGGVGALVTAPALDFANRIDMAKVPPTPGHGGLNGSSIPVSDPANPLGLAKPSVLDDWKKIIAYVQNIRSVRRPTTLDPAKVQEGKDLFMQANCQGCHGGGKWTISQVFYTPDPSNVLPTSLKTKSWATAVTNAGFPTALLPSDGTVANSQNMRYNTGSSGDGMVCIIRPVGTYNVAETAIWPTGYVEVTSSGTPAAGNFADYKGFNPPALIGNAVGAPYFHAGQARTLEATFNPPFQGHYQALAPGFLADNDPNRNAKIAALVQFLLSIDEDQDTIPVPALGPQGGNFCTTQ